MSDTWDPAQYGKFRSERSQPFFDLCDLIEPLDGGRCVDLGCGPGDLTALLRDLVGAGDTVGIDNSQSMLEQAAANARTDVRFVHGDIGAFFEPSGYDLVFANAALQWVPDHERVLTAWRDSLRGGGQLAVQVPANIDHPAHLAAGEVANEEPFRSAFGDANPPPDTVVNVLAPERYASLLDELGFARQHVRLQIYGHRLDSTADVVEWVKGTSLTRFRRALEGDLWDVYLARYRQRVLEVLGDRRPYFYPFKRILLWGRLG